MSDTAAPYHHGNLRTALLILAERKLEQTGVSGLSLRELAREAGVSHGAPRPHFPDKQALLDALAVRGLAELGERLDADLELRRGTSFENRLLAFARVYIGFATEHPVLLGLMFTRKEEPGAPEVRAANDRAFAAPQALIADAYTSGDITGDEPDQVAMAVLATVAGLAAIITSGMIGDRPADRVITGTIRTLARGLRGPSPSPGTAPVGQGTTPPAP
jgi:AcrR family transcriptional regulator